MQHAMITINESTGDTRFLVSALTGGLIEKGVSIVRRASHVEPAKFWPRVIFKFIRFFSLDDSEIAEWTRNWNCCWRVNLGPVSGPVLPGIWSNRRDAIEAEIEWLEENFL